MTAECRREPDESPALAALAGVRSLRPRAPASAGQPQRSAQGGEGQTEAGEQTQQAARRDGVEQRVVRPVVVEVGAPGALRQLGRQVRRQHERQRLRTETEDEARRRAGLEEADDRAPEHQTLARRAGEAIGALHGDCRAADEPEPEETGEQETGPPPTGAGARESAQHGEDDRCHRESEKGAACRRPQRDRRAGERQSRGREGGRALACPPAADRPAGGDRQQPNQCLGEEERVTLSGGRSPLPIDLPAQRIESCPLQEGVGDQSAGRGEPRGLAALPARDRAQARRQDEEEDEQREHAGEPEEARRGSEETAQRVDRGHRRDELRGARGERPAHQGRSQTSAQRRRSRSARRALSERRERRERESTERQDLQHEEAVRLGTELAVGVLEEERHPDRGPPQTLEAAVEARGPARGAHPAHPVPRPGVWPAGARGGKSAPSQNPPPQARCIVAKTAGSGSAVRRPRRRPTARATPQLVAR